jgi:hypothetical protein
MRTDALVLHRVWTKASNGLGPLSGLPTFESLPGRTSCYLVALYGGAAVHRDAPLRAATQLYSRTVPELAPLGHAAFLRDAHPLQTALLAPR